MGSFIRYPLTKIGENFRVIFAVGTSVNEISSFKGKTINKSTITKVKGKNLVDYYNVNMYPYIEIDFTSYDDIKEGVSISGACKINLNKYNLYLFLNIIKRLERDFITIKDLYYYSNGKLVLNKEVGNNITIKTGISDKIVMIGPTVIEVGGGEKQHEGIYLALNDLSNITFLTYTEMGYLRYILDKVDLDVMGLELINLVGENKIVTNINNTTISIDKVCVKPEEQDNSSSNNFILKSENVIPQI